MKIKILVVGCGNMGASHALAYHNLPDFQIVGLVSTGNSNSALNQKLGGQYPLFKDYYEALAATQPDAVSINTYPDTHEPFALAALEKGCHIFMEKPIAATVEGAEKIASMALDKIHRN
jgi:predicted dehydrogenase